MPLVLKALLRAILREIRKKVPSSESWIIQHGTDLFWRKSRFVISTVIVFLLVTSAWLSPTYGSQKQKTDKRIIFALESPSEHINRLEVRAGAWIDGLRIHSNMKSSVWIGGSGGDLNELRAPDGQWFDNIFGTTGRYVGSIGVKLNR